MSVKAQSRALAGNPARDGVCPTGRAGLRSYGGLPPPPARQRAGLAFRAQPMPVTCSAVVQLFLMALRAAESVMVPAQTAFFSLVSTPSLVEAVGLP